MCPQFSFWSSGLTALSSLSLSPSLSTLFFLQQIILVSITLSASSAPSIIIIIIGIPLQLLYILGKPPAKNQRNTSIGSTIEPSGYLTLYAMTIFLYTNFTNDASPPAPHGSALYDRTGPDRTESDPIPPATASAIHYHRLQPALAGSGQAETSIPTPETLSSPLAFGTAPPLPAIPRVAAPKTESAEAR